MYHMGIYMYSVANIFEAEQHLTNRTLDLNIPHKRNLLKCRLSLIWITNVSTHCKTSANISAVTLFLPILPSSFWVNHCTTGLFID